MKLDMRKKQEKKETTKSTKKLPMTAKMKRAMAVYIAMVLIMTAGASTVFAADDPLTVINNLSTFIFGLIRAIGMILLGFGIVQVGLSLKSHDPSQRANGILTLAGGDYITFAKEFLLDMSDAGKQVHFKAMRKLASEHPSEKVGEEIRKLYSWNGEDKLINN